MPSVVGQLVHQSLLTSIKSAHPRVLCNLGTICRGLFVGQHRFAPAMIHRFDSYPLLQYKEKRYMTKRHGNTTHGFSGVGDGNYSHRPPSYRSWLNMKQRCNNPNNPDYHYYGERGIKVCERWTKYENFLSDMGHPSKRLTLDRINVDGDYEPSNCRWATRKEQSRNTRATNIIEYKGIKKPLAVWADEIGMSFSNLYKRIYTRGWDIDRAMTQPERKRNA